jgi:hypothetical protein
VDHVRLTGADPGFQVRGGALKKIAPSGGRREIFWGISCEKSRFYAKKYYFFPLAEGGAKIFGVFRVKNHDFTPKNLIFSNFRGGARDGCAPPPLDPPLFKIIHVQVSLGNKLFIRLIIFMSLYIYMNNYWYIREILLIQIFFQMSVSSK